MAAIDKSIQFEVRAPAGGGGGATALSSAVAGMASGTTQVFSAMNVAAWLGQADPWAWNARLHWHDGPAQGQGKLYGVSKTAGSSGVPYRLHYYDEETNVADKPFDALWGAIGGGSESGHAYDGGAIDDEGSFYFLNYMAERPVRWNGASWTDAIPNFQSNVTAGGGVMDFHPDLFGAGDGGLVIPQNNSGGQPSYVYCWRKSSNTYDALRSSERAAGFPGDVGQSQAVYAPALGASVITTSTDLRAWMVRRQGGAITVTAMPNNLPVYCTTNESGGNRMNRLVVTPAGTLAILETVWGAARVWRLDPTTLEWTLQGWTHTLLYSSGAATRLVGALLKRYGVYLFLRPTSSGAGHALSMMLFKPPLGF